MLISVGWNLVPLKNSILKGFTKQKRKIEKKTKEKPQPAPSPTPAQPSTPLPSFFPPSLDPLLLPGPAVPAAQARAHSLSPPSPWPADGWGPLVSRAPFPFLQPSPRWTLPRPNQSRNRRNFLAKGVKSSPIKLFPTPQFPFPRPSRPNQVLAPYTASFGSRQRYPPPQRAPSHPCTLPAQEKCLGAFAAHSSTSP